MHDPDEGVGPDGSIITGVRRDRVPAVFEPVIAAAVDAIIGSGLYLYGSVATGRARVGVSDVDLVSIGVPADTAALISEELSRQFRWLCRGVAIGAGQPLDSVGPSDEAYGNRVFLRHYCVQLAGPPRTDLDVTYPADDRAARGFNGDIAMNARHWRQQLDDGANPAAVANRLARKTLMTVASLVSVHDLTWTTDRGVAARRWSEIDPRAAPDLATLLGWATAAGAPPRPEVEEMLDGTVSEVVKAFRDTIGLWPG